MKAEQLIGCVSASVLACTCMCVCGDGESMTSLLEWIYESHLSHVQLQ